jgi:hypothetical protein
MKKPDLLVCWIKHCDYPLFRRFLRRHRSRFAKVIIYWSEHFRNMYYNRFIEKDLADLNITFLQNIPYKYGYEDWRNIATNLMLKSSDSEWVCSIEQDFFTRDWDKLFALVDKARETNDLVGWGAKAGIKNFYIHPSFWFMKRSVLEQTRMDFSATQGEDHFGLITRDAENLKAKIYCIERDGGLRCDVSSDADCFHQGGINQNYLQADENYAYHRTELFYIYNWWSLRAGVQQNQEFNDLMVKVEGILKRRFPDIDPQDPEWSVFYQ